MSHTTAPFAVLLCLALASVCISYWVTLTDDTVAFYSLTTRFWELLAGALLLESEHSFSQVLAACVQGMEGSLDARRRRCGVANPRTRGFFPWRPRSIFRGVAKCRGRHCLHGVWALRPSEKAVLTNTSSPSMPAAVSSFAERTPIFMRGATFMRKHACGTGRSLSFSDSIASTRKRRSSSNSQHLPSV